MRYIFRKISKKRIWKRIFLERLSEPIHLNIISLFVFLFGSFKRKVDYDLVLRPQYAYGILESALAAKSLGLKSVSVIEFGVASGSGIINMIEIAKKVTQNTGINIDIYGFDTGTGMPKPVDFRDHPDLYNFGDFPMEKELLEKAINGKAKILFGNISDKISEFEDIVSPTSPIGFVSIDVDYYSSTVDTLKVFDFEAEKYLPLTYIYLDDTTLLPHNSLCGEMLAVNEYNKRNNLRIIEYHHFFEKYRIFKNAIWTKQIYFLHMLDHPKRMKLENSGSPRVIENPYLSYEENKEVFTR